VLRILALTGAAVLDDVGKGPNGKKLAKQLPPKSLTVPGEYIVTVRPGADINTVLRR
jgi:hypothetical protein